MDNKLMPQMQLIDIKKVAEMLGVKPPTIYNWAEMGRIPYVKLNGALRFDPEDLLKWIQSCKKQVSSGYNPLTQGRSPNKGGKTKNGAI